MLTRSPSCSLFPPFLPRYSKQASHRRCAAALPEALRADAPLTQEKERQGLEPTFFGVPFGFFLHSPTLASSLPLPRWPSTRPHLGRHSRNGADRPGAMPACDSFAPQTLKKQSCASCFLRVDAHPAGSGASAQSGSSSPTPDVRTEEGGCARAFAKAELESAPGWQLRQSVSSSRRMNEERCGRRSLRALCVAVSSARATWRRKRRRERELWGRAMMR